MILQTSQTTTLDSILAEPPLVHADGSLIWGLSEDVLRYLDDTLQPGAKTLETGAGLSTLLFALKSSEHTCIVPSEQEIERIRAYCLKKDISLDNVTFIADYSQNVVPTLSRADLDLVLIDGGHGYPIPAIDWFYTAPMLKTGGVVIVDDVQIWTGAVLKQFLALEETWELAGNFTQSAAYRKVGQDYAREWKYQPYVTQKSKLPNLITKAQIALTLLSKGEFSKLIQKIKR